MHTSTDIRTDYFGIIMYIRIIPFLLYIDPSGVGMLPVAAGQNGSGHDKGHFGQSGVRAPALRSGHSTWHYFSSFSLLLLSSEALSFLPERR